MEMIAFHIFVIVNTIEGCHNYTTHNESWRNVNNNMVVQPNTTSCDNKKLMTNGWHRFIGVSGTRLHNVGQRVLVGLSGNIQRYLEKPRIIYCISISSIALMILVQLR